MLLYQWVREDYYRCGPREQELTVKYVTISLSRHQNITIRVGLVDDDKADNILREYFFPPGVTCRPWRRMSSPRAGTRDHRRDDSYTGSDKHSYAADDI